MKYTHGFTLIELIIVITVIAVLAGIAIPVTGSILDEAKKSKAKAEVEELYKAILRFNEDTTFWPNQEDFRAVADWNNNSNGLVGTNPGLYPGWKGPYLTRQITTDPWGNPYIYDGGGRTGQADRGVGRNCVMSMGPNGRNDGSENRADLQAQGDDIVLYFR